MAENIGLNESMYNSNNTLSGKSRQKTERKIGIRINMHMPNIIKEFLTAFWTSTSKPKRVEGTENVTELVSMEFYKYDAIERFQVN